MVGRSWSGRYIPTTAKDREKSLPLETEGISEWFALCSSSRHVFLRRGSQSRVLRLCDDSVATLDATVKRSVNSEARMNGNFPNRGRRRLLLGAPALLLGATVSGPVSALSSTPPQSEGPFYPRSIPSDSDADLTVFNGERAPGEVIEMVGRLFDAKGQVLSGGNIEIWHCDVNGVYAHVGQSTPPGFQGYGAVRTDGSGNYRFRTTRPGIYPGRTRHIHVKVRSADGADLTTQMYFPGEPGNERDGLLRRARDPGALIARKEAGSPPRYVFDIVLA
ncbi:hypothetical protein EU800_23165 [Tropicimonas sp. IMCC6043]|nr:hypothetical protein EU800_23165 [Tropicimonas sp. IMCC6043]